MEAKSPSVLALATVLLAFVGCGSSGTTTTGSTAGDTTPSAVGGGIKTGSARCNQAELGKALQTAASQTGQPVELVAPGSFSCADGWAAVQANVGTGTEAVTETFIFEAEGQFWIPKDRSKVCGQPPEVPEPIRTQACASN